MDGERPLYSCAFNIYSKPSYETTTNQELSFLFHPLGWTSRNSVGTLGMNIPAD
jgi:hypothetical protein